MQKCIKIFPERKNTMLGKTVYFLDFKNNAVKEGVVYDIHITSSGYAAYQLLVKDSFIQVETSLCYETQEKAEKGLKKKQFQADYITNLAKESQARIDELREKLLGKPEFAHMKGIK